MGVSPLEAGLFGLASGTIVVLLILAGRSEEEILPVMIASAVGTLTLTLLSLFGSVK